MILLTLGRAFTAAIVVAGSPHVDSTASRVRVKDIEAALAEIGEISAARVVVTPEGTISEVHVIALPTKQPKQLVRDIESTLMARFAIPIDHKRISIALLGREALADPESRSSHIRPRIISVHASTSGVQASVSVTLEIAETEYVGIASGPASQTGRSRLVAMATLDAISQYSVATIAFALEDVTIVQLGRETVAVSCISLVSGFGEQTLSGSALVRQNDNDSIVRATLDAINRRMGFLTTE